jgi:fructose-bisphosphate aldolase class 1
VIEGVSIQDLLEKCKTFNHYATCFLKWKAIKIKIAMNLSIGIKNEETIDFQFCDKMQTQGAFPNSPK